MSTTLVLNGSELDLPGFVGVVRHARPVALGAEVEDRVLASRRALEAKLARGELIYGVSTGFGANVRYAIGSAHQAELQTNVLRALCCGTGPELSEEVVRGAILLRVNALAKGYSAVRPAVLDCLIGMLNAGITPIVPRHGSVGASGDLVPSAYIASALSGAGAVRVKGARTEAEAALAAAGLAPVPLAAKEGLALVNGTTVMTSLAALALDEFAYLTTLLIGAVAMSTEVLRATGASFTEAIQRLKNHPGQIEVARRLRAYTAGSSLIFDLDCLREALRGEAQERHGAGRELECAIQTPYSLRCAPQGLGPALDSLAWAGAVVAREMNSVNDNPLVDPEADAVYHTGNFYGGHVARAMDGLKLDIANAANWAHALMAMLMDPRFSNGLPASLAAEPGLHSGFKGMQLSQTSLVCLCRQLAAPSAVHTLPTEQYNQDIVSLGLHAASAALDMSEHLRDVLAMLLLALCQAADLRGVGRNAERLGAGSAAVYRAVRAQIPYVAADRYMGEEIAALARSIAARGITLPA
ncbi:MAG TPA: aromatic amino acid ammonia-lyase [Gammaproteobacteria bacterium]|nr:aromatic amino acid ammonia-lyase [Gammaproteobacteria bacterium]